MRFRLGDEEKMRILVGERLKPWAMRKQIKAAMPGEFGRKRIKGGACYCISVFAIVAGHPRELVDLMEGRIINGWPGDV
jgi:hypothetical protein